MCRHGQMPRARLEEVLHDFLCPGKLAVTGISPPGAPFAPPEPSHTGAASESAPAELPAARQPTPPDSPPSPGSPEFRSGGAPEQRTAAFLISTIVHTFVLILLALWTVPETASQRVRISVRKGPPSRAVSFEVDDPQRRSPTKSAAEPDRPVPVTMPASGAVAVRSPLVSRSPRSASQTPLPAAYLAPGGRPEQPALQRLPSGGLSGRSPSRRRELGRRFGATPESERAVELALRWLAEHQQGDGSWSFDLNQAPCNGRCDHSRQPGDTGTSATPATAATGLALLAFLGAGHTEHQGEYAETVRRGLYYLRGAADESATGLDWQQGNMYGHGIALMALSEALTMSAEAGREDEDLYERVRRGASFSCAAQHPSGSWGYVPGSPGDTTLTAWQVLALLEAHRNDVPLGTTTLSDAKEFFLSTSPDGSYAFGYQGPPAEPTTTAIGLTALLYLGQSPTYTPMFEALNKLAERGPSLTADADPTRGNVYHDYYGTLALHHARHRDWDRWNQPLRDHLIATQATSGHQRGSWHFHDRYGDIGGRLYTTAMCTMILEVYYRFLPLYDTYEEFPL